MSNNRTQGFIKTQLKRYQWFYIAAFLYCLLMYATPESSNYDWLSALYAGFKTMAILFAIIFIGALIYSWQLAIERLLDAINKKYTAKDYRRALRQAKQEEDVDEDFVSLLTLRPRGFYLYLPKNGRLAYSFGEMRLALADFAKIIVKPLALKHKLPLSNRRFFDLVFLNHYIFEHLMGENSTDAGLLERLRYDKLYYLQLRKEIADWDNLRRKKNKTNQERKFLKLYNDIYIVGYLQIREEDRYDLIH